MRVTGRVMMERCQCGCEQPLTRNKKAPNQIYLSGHSPHIHGRRQSDAEGAPITRYPEKPGCCQKCQGLSLVEDTAWDLLSSATAPVLAWRCLSCSWRGYMS